MLLAVLALSAIIIIAVLAEHDSGQAQVPGAGRGKMRAPLAATMRRLSPSPVGAPTIADTGTVR